MDAVAGSVIGMILGFGIAMIGIRVSAATGRLERKLDLLIRHAGIDLQAVAAEEAAALNRAGNKIGAIKAYRELTGCGLAEAKTKVENMV